MQTCFSTLVTRVKNLKKTCTDILGLEDVVEKALIYPLTLARESVNPIAEGQKSFYWVQSLL